MKKPIIFLLFLTAVVAGFFFYRHKTGVSSDRESALLYHGSVELRRVNLSFRTGGRIEEFLVEEGNPVEKGQVVARLDRAPLDVDVASAEAARDQANAAYERAVNGPRRQELDEARAQAAEYRAALVLAEAELERNRGLVGKNAVSQSLYDTSLSQRDASKARVDRAEANVSLLEEGTRREDVELARATLAQAEAALERARIAAADTELVAPGDGVLLTRVAEPGAMASAGQTVATLSLRDVVWVYIFVEEPDLGKVVPGAEVEIRTDSSDKVYFGHIGYVSPEAEFTPKTVETPNLRTNLVYRTRIVVSDPDDGLRQGAPVDVTIPLDSHETDDSDVESLNDEAPNA